MEFSHPLASAVPAHEKGDIRQHYRKIIAERQLGSLANDTKWNELLSTIRSRENGWKPGYRWKCLNGPPSEWDIEWWCHLPLPFISCEWFDIGFIQKSATGETIDHSKWVEALLKQINFDFIRGTEFFRIFAYSPKNMDGFE